MNLKAFISIIFLSIAVTVFCENSTLRHSPLLLQQKTIENYSEDHEWAFASQRDEIAPLHSKDKDGKFKGTTTLVLAGGGKEYANGGWVTVKDVQAGKYYRFKVSFQAEMVEQPDRTIYSSILWLDENDKKVSMTEFPPTLEETTSDGFNIIEKVYQVPKGASKARLELGYRWDADGSVCFGDFSFLEVDKPMPRNVKLATVLHRPRNSKGSHDNLEQFANLIDEAGKQQADIICLPEAITLVGTDQDYISAAESIPGPSTRFLGEVAKKHNMYIVAGLLEKEGEVVYNTAVLINRQGELAGKYRKVSLPREEIEGGITPGDELPVFDTDFGKIGIMICWDVQFPEVSRSLAMKGAEVILLPIWGGDLTLTKARAIENQVYLVSSTYDMKSAVFDLKGNIIGEATKSNPVVVTEVDLNEQVLWDWLGDLKNRVPREIPSKSSIEW